MLRIFLAALLFITLLTVALSGSGAGRAPQAVLLRAGRLLDVRTGVYLENRGVLVAEGRIKAVGEFETVRRAAPSGVRVIDLSRAFVLPGLIDCHSHLFLANDGQVDKSSGMTEAERLRLAERNARELLMAGVTTARNVGHSGTRGDAVLRDEIEAGKAQGPRIIPATRKLTPPGGQPLMSTPATKEILARDFLTVGSVDEARRAVREAQATGAGVIKIVVDVGKSLLGLDEIKAIVSEAHRLKLKVAAHATTEEGARRAALAGVDSIEHGTEASDETFRLMAERGIFLVANDYTPEQLRQIFAANLASQPGLKEDFEAWLKDYTTKSPARLQRALKAGVRIAFGSDMVFMFPGKTRGQASLLVLEALRGEGLSPQECIRAATLSAAELLGWQDRVGTIETGKLADIIAFDKDPLKDISELQRVRLVIKGGVVVKDELTGQALNP
ncbi:MAG TPA: amidohydrolase family protein [Pyrinomonadaceae bacterium]|nr:amidohydrolase family protein [Pyrinomonadaceae bacterium]